MKELKELISQLVAEKDVKKRAELASKIELKRSQIVSQAQTDAIQKINDAMQKAKIK